MMYPRQTLKESFGQDGRPIVFFNEKLSNVKKNYSMYD